MWYRVRLGLLRRLKLALIASNENSNEDDISTALVFLADQAYFILNGSFGADTWSFKKIKKAMDRCGLSEEEMDTAIFELKSSVNKFNELLQ